LAALLPEGSVRRIATLGSLFQRPGQHVALLAEHGGGKATLVEQAAIAVGARFTLVESNPLAADCEAQFVRDLVSVVAGQAGHGPTNVSKDAMRPAPSSSPLVVAVRASRDHPLSTALLSHVDLLMRTGRHSGIRSGRHVHPRGIQAHEARLDVNEAAAAARQRDLALRRAFGDAHRGGGSSATVDVDLALPCILPVTLHLVLLIDADGGTGLFPGMTQRAATLLSHGLLCADAHRMRLPLRWDFDETAHAVTRALALAPQASLLQELARQVAEAELAADLEAARDQQEASPAAAQQPTQQKLRRTSREDAEAQPVTPTPRLPEVAPDLALQETQEAPEKSSASARGGMFARRLPSIGVAAPPSAAQSAAGSLGGAGAGGQMGPDETEAAADGSAIRILHCAARAPNTRLLREQLGRLLADMYGTAGGPGRSLSGLQESVASFCRLLVERRNALHETLVVARGDLHMLTQKETYIQAFERQTTQMSHNLREGRDARGELFMQLSHLDASSEALEQEMQELETAIAERSVPVQELQQFTGAERAAVQPFLLEVAEQLKSLRKEDLDELRTYVNPPTSVQETLKPVCLLMRGKYGYKNGSLPRGLDEPTWPEAVALLHQPNLYEDLRNYDMGHVPDKLLREVKRHTEKRHYDPTQLANASLAAAFLSRWVRATVAYATVAQKCRPVLRKLRKAEQVLKKMQAKAAAVRRQLVEIGEQRALLRKSLQQADEELGEQESGVSVLQQKLTRVRQLGNVTADILKRHRRTIDECQQGLRCLLGDVAIAAGALSYLQTTRPEAVESRLDAWLQSASVFGIVASPRPRIASLLPFPDSSASVEAREAALYWQRSTAISASLLHYARPGSVVVIDPYVVTASAYGAGRGALLNRHDALLYSSSDGRALPLGEPSFGHDLELGLDVVDYLADCTAVALQHCSPGRPAEFLANQRLAFGVVEAPGVYARIAAGLPSSAAYPGGRPGAAGSAESDELQQLTLAPADRRGPSRGLCWVENDDPSIGQERLLNAILATVEPGAFHEWMDARRTSQHSRAKQRAFESDILSRMQSLSDSSFETDLLLEDLQGVRLRASAHRRRHMGKLWGKATLGDKRERYRSIATLGERVFTWLGALAAEDDAYVMSWPDFTSLICQALSSFSPLSHEEGDTNERTLNGEPRGSHANPEDESENALFAGDTYAVQAMKEAVLKQVLQQLWRKGDVKQARTAALTFVLQLLRSKDVMGAAGAALFRRALMLQQTSAPIHPGQSGKSPEQGPDLNWGRDGDPHVHVSHSGPPSPLAPHAPGGPGVFLVTDATEAANSPPLWLAAYGGSWAATRELGDYHVFPKLLQSLREESEEWLSFLQPGTALLVPAPCERSYMPFARQEMAGNATVGGAQAETARLSLWERLLLWQILAPRLAPQRAWELVVSYLGPISFGPRPSLAGFLEQMYHLRNATGAETAEEEAARAAGSALELEGEEDEADERASRNTTPGLSTLSAAVPSGRTSRLFSFLETQATATKSSAFGVARRNRRDVALLHVPASETSSLAGTLAATVEAAGNRRWELRALRRNAAFGMARYSAQRTSGAVDAEVELIFVVCHDPESAATFLTFYLQQYDQLQAMVAAQKRRPPGLYDGTLLPDAILEEEEGKDEDAREGRNPGEGQESGGRPGTGTGGSQPSSANKTRRQSTTAHARGSADYRSRSNSLAAPSPPHTPLIGNSQRRRAQLVLTLMENHCGDWAWRQRHVPLWAVAQRRLQTLVLHDAGRDEGLSSAQHQHRDEHGGIGGSSGLYPSIWLAVNTLADGAD
jgi:hypothetical protein